MKSFLISKNFINSLSKIIPILIILLAFSMSFWRAINLSIAHDEALTENIFVPQPYSYILGFTGSINGVYANNHPLNTALMKLSSSLFGISEISTRLPALVGQLIYLVAGYILVSLLFSQWWKKSIAMSFLAFHPFLIDYFSAARGYALSLGLLALGIAMIAYSVRSPIGRNYKWSEIGLLLSSLAATNNLNFIHAFLALTICHLCVTLRTQRRNRVFLFSRGLIIALIPPILVYVRNFWKAYTTGAFYVGGQEGFWKDTLPSLINITTYHFDPNISYQILKIIFLFIVGVGIWVVYKAHKPVPVFYTSVFFLTMVSVYFSFEIAHVEVVVERGAIYLIFLFSIFILSVWNSLEIGFKNRVWSVLLIGIILFITGYYLTNIQFSYYYTWPYDRHTKEAFSTIINDYKNSGRTGKITIGATWLFEPSLNFYRIENNDNFVEPITRATTNESYTYYYLLGDFVNAGQVENMEEIKEKYNLKILEHFNDTNSFVLVSN